MNKIKFYREKNSMTLRQLAEKSKVSFGHISDLENGVRTNPSRETMIHIAEALGCTVQAVFFPEDKEQEDING